MKANDSNNYLNTLAKTYIRSLGIGVLLIIGFCFFAIVCTMETWELWLGLGGGVAGGVIACIVQQKINKKKKDENRDPFDIMRDIDDLTK